MTDQIKTKLENIYALAINAFESQKILALGCEDPKAQADEMLAAQKLLDTALNAVKLETQFEIDLKKPQATHIRQQNNQINITDRKAALAAATKLNIPHNEIPAHPDESDLEYHD